MKIGSMSIGSPVILSVSLLLVIVMMILPMPSWLLDFGLAASFALAVLVFTVTLFIERPLDFSAFPSILLASLVLRLSLNVSSTKLIIGQGHTGTAAAGHVIEGFAKFVMGGSLVLGLVIFCVLLIVNFVVINKGATRMAEVGARFALDAMPGKQMAIDSDVAAGAIDHEQARERRATEQAETTFFGSLDGASKFVKGDAIAGLLITAMNLVVGLSVGIFSHGMDAAVAFQTYSILTVGDGLVSQIPAVVISVGAALLLAKGGTRGATDSEMTLQLGRHPAAIATVAFVMAILALVPGLPFVPFMIGAGILGMIAYFAARNAGSVELPEVTEVTASDEQATESIGDMLELDDLHVSFAPDLIDMVLDPGTGLDARILNMRRHVAAEFGVVMPPVRLTDDPSLSDGSYVIKVQGVRQAQDRLRPNRILALKAENHQADITGEQVEEPVYGAPAVWISANRQDEVAMQGATTVQPAEVLATHLLEVVKQNLPRLLTFRSLQQRLDELSNLRDTSRAALNKRMVDDLVPDRVPFGVLLAVLRLLLEERVSIRNLPLIIEAIAEAGHLHKSIETLTEFVRQRIGFQLVAEVKRDDGSIPLIQLAGEWEEVFLRHELRGDHGASEVALPPETFKTFADRLAAAYQAANDNGVEPALVTTMRRRRFVRTVAVAKGLSLPILSFEEIGVEARPSLVGVVDAA